MDTEQEILEWINEYNFTLRSPIGILYGTPTGKTYRGFLQHIVYSRHTDMVILRFATKSHIYSRRGMQIKISSSIFEHLQDYKDFEYMISCFVGPKALREKTYKNLLDRLDN